MKQKQQQNKERLFEMNGGYYIDGIPYMDCKITGEPVRNVGTEATSVIGSKAVMARINKLFPDQDKPRRVKTGRPAGWHWMNEFVDKDGNVFHKGKEQPDLKGTLPPTKIKPKKKVKHMSKEEMLLARHEKKKKVLKKAKTKLQKKNTRR